MGGAPSYSNQYSPPPPPLGDISTKELAHCLACAARFEGAYVPLRLSIRNATIDDARRELIRRERLGVGVQQ